MTSAGDDMTDRGKLTPVLTRRWLSPTSWTIDTYRQFEGYSALRTALSAHPDQLIQLIKDSGLRGRGGAGFPTGLKWSFIPQGATGPGAKPKYLVVNADEGEPGTCKDTPLMMADPHSLVEGTIISSYAIRANFAVIYIRGEIVHAIRRVRAAVEGAYAAGYLGKDILGSGFDLDVVVHAGAGAYICGEETALLDSLEGFRGQPRLRPPFPAVAGLYASPTVINNVESIASVPSIIDNGAEWFASMGTEKSKGYGIFSLSGHIARPGQYEAPLGITLRQLLELGGGMREGSELKFWTPGGSSTPILTAEHLDVPLDYEAVGEAGSMLGTKALQVFDQTTSVVRCVLRWTSSTSTSRVASAPRAVRAPGGWCRPSSVSMPARAGTVTSNCCSISATTSLAARSVPSVMERRARSPRRSSTSARSSTPACTRHRAGPSRRPRRRSSRRRSAHDDPRHAKDGRSGRAHHAHDR